MMQVYGQTYYPDQKPRQDVTFEQLSKVAELSHHLINFEKQNIIEHVKGIGKLALPYFKR